MALTTRSSTRREARDEPDQPQVTPHPTDLPRATMHVIELLTPRARARGIELRAQLDRAPFTVLIDPVHYQQVLVNLVDNAIRFTDQGGVEVSVDHQPLEGDRVLLDIRVTDSGIGIAPDEQARIFEGPTQAEWSTGRLSGGTGPGLAVCRRLLEMMGGEIGVQSEPGRGSTFRMRLPATLGGRVSHRSTPRAAPAVGMGLRVLLVDDNRVARLVGQRQLEKLGCEVAVAENGMVALDLHAPGKFDVVLMDCHMPVMNGFDATREIRQREAGGPQTAVIGLTASIVKDDHRKCVEAGMDSVNLKPTDQRRLQELLTKVLTR